MKNRYKLLFLLISIILVPSHMRAQSWGVAMYASVVGENEMLVGGGAITYEKVITPKFAVTSGAMLRSVEDPLNEYYKNYETGRSAERRVLRVVAPVGVEYKFCITETLRIYINPAVTANFNVVAYSPYYKSSYSEDYKLFNVGASVGAGVEFGFVRIGVLYDHDLYQITAIASDPYISNLSIYLGFRLAGNRLYRQKSKLNYRNVRYPILKE